MVVFQLPLAPIGYSGLQALPDFGSAMAMTMLSKSAPGPDLVGDRPEELDGQRRPVGARRLEVDRLDWRDCGCPAGAAIRGASATSAAACAGSIGRIEMRSSSPRSSGK